MTIELIETRDKLIVSDDGSELIQVITQGEQGVGIDPGVKGVITIPANLIDWTLTDNVVTSSKIVDGTIVNADINDNAAIALTKLATGALPTAITVTSANISDLSIVNADINASAAIAGTKISPDFGSQNIVTTGTAATGALGVTGNLTVSGTVDGRDVATDGTKLDGIETGATADQTKSDIDALGIAASTAATLATSRNIGGVSFNGSANIDLPGVNTAGNQNTSGNAATATALETARTIAGTSFDGSANIDISYTNLTNKLSVGDGGLTQNNFTDALKTKLDGVETGATADQTAAEIKTLLNSNGIVNAQVDASAAIAGSKISPDFGSQTVTSSGVNVGTNLELSSSGDSDVNHGSSSNSLRLRHNGATKLAISSSAATFTTDIAGTGSLTLTSSTTNEVAAPIIELYRNSSSPADADYLGQLKFTGEDDQGAKEVYAKLTAKIDDASGGTEDGILEFTLRKNSTNNICGRFTSTDLKLINGTGLEVAGNISCDGTVDGRDVATDGSKLDGIEANAINASNTAITNKLPLAGGTVTGNLTVGGNFTVNGTTTTIDTTTLTVEDKNIELGKVSTPTDTTADQGGITLLGATNKTFQWLDATDSWTSSEHIALPDNKKLRLGASQDLELFHDGSHSRIVDAGTGNLVIQTDGYRLRSTDETEVLMMASKNSSTDLYYDNVKRLETTSTGASVTGSLGIGTTTVPELLSIAADAPCGISILDTGHSYAATTLKVGNLGRDFLIVAPEDIRLKPAGGEDGLTVKNNGAVEAYYDNVKRFETTSTGIKVTGTTTTGSEFLGDFRVKGTDDSNFVTFKPSENLVRWHDNDKAVFGGSNDLEIYFDSSNSIIKHTPTGSGELQLRTRIFKVHSNNNSEVLIKAVENAQTELYYDHSKKLDTQTNGTRIYDSLGIGADSTSTALLNLRTPDGSSGNNTTKKGIIIRDGAFSDGELIDCRDSTGSTFFSVDGSLNVNLTDNRKLQLGDSQDLAIWHSGSHSYIQNITNNLYIHSNELVLRSTSQEEFIDCSVNGSVDLFYDDVKKLETTSAGVAVTGQLTTTGDITVSSAFPKIYLTAINHNPDWSLINSNGEFKIFSETDSSSRLKIKPNGNVEVLVNLQIPNDTGKLQLGTSQDLQIYHSGSASFIDHDGTGNLVIRSISSQAQVYGTEVLLMKQNGIEKMFRGVADGTAELYYDNSKKLETTSTGVSVTGGVTSTTGGLITIGNVETNADNSEFRCGANADFKISHSGTENILRSDFPTVFRNAANNETLALFTPNGATELYYDNVKKFATRSNGAEINGIGYVRGLNGTDGILALYADNGDDNDDNWRLLATHTGSNFQIDNYAGGAWETSIKAVGNGAVEAYYDNTKKFETTSDGATVTGKLTSDGLVLGDAETIAFGNTTNGDFKIYHDGTNASIQNITGNLYLYGGGGAIYLRPSTDDEHGIVIAPNAQVELYYNGSKKFETSSAGVTVTGDITATGTITSNDITISDQQPRINFTDTNGNPDYLIQVDGGHFLIHDATNGADKIKIQSDGHIDITPNTDFAGGIDVTGNVVVSGGANESPVTVTTSNDYVGKFESTDAHARLIVEDNTSTTGHNGLQVFGDTCMLVAGNAFSVRGIGGGATELLHDGTKRFETTAGGTLVTGSLGTTDTITSGGHIKTGTDTGKIFAGASNELQFYHDGTDSHVKNNSGVFYIQAANNIVFQNTSGEKYIKAIENGAVELYYDNSKKLETTSDGATFSGSPLLPDNVRLKIGGDASNPDLQIYHDGTNTRIIEEGTGELYLDTSSFRIRNSNGSENVAKFISDGAVELYHNNSKKFFTLSDGVEVDGHLYLMDNDNLKLGNGSDLLIYHNGSDSYVKNTTGDLYIRDTNGNIFIQPKTDENAIKCVADGAVELYYDNSKKFETTSIGNQVTGQLVVPDGGNNSGNNNVTFGSDNDCHVYHNGTDFYIVNTTGNLDLRAKAGEKSILAAPDGAVELYHDNIKTFETISGGAKLQGGEGLAAHLYMFADEGDDNADKWVFRADASSSQLKLRNYAGGSWEESIIANGNGAVELYYDNSKKLETTSTGAFITKELEIEGTAVNDFESGRVRFTENAHGFLGGYVHYDGSANVFYIGVHPLNDTTVGNDVNSIKMNRATGSEYVELNYSGNKKLETTSSGITVTGSVTTQDMNMSNLNGNANEVDNTKGSWSIQEGSDDLFIINRVTGKKYKFNLTEIS